MSEVNLEHINKTYPNGFQAVKDFNLDIADGEFIIFVGPSGCGKSTTLRMIAGLEDISGGDLVIDGNVVNDVEPKDRDIAMVFQNYALYPHMTVKENMEFPLKIAKLPQEEIDKRVAEAARTLDLEKLLDRKPKALSGGQRQRVAMGRAIVRNPKVLLLDEPLSNLDAKLRGQMRVEISRLHERLGATMVYVTHDQTEAMTLGDRIVVMSDGEVQQIDTPQFLYDHPANKFVAGFIGSPQMNFIDATVKEGKRGKVVVDVCGTELELNDDQSAQLRNSGYIDKEVTLGIRPENLSDHPDDIARHPECVVDAKVDVRENLGAEVYLYTDFEGNSITARVNPETNAMVGDKIKIAFEPDKIHIFDKDTEKAVF